MMTIRCPVCLDIEDMMKRFLLRILPLVLGALMLFSACAKPPEFERENGVYAYEKGGVSYVPAPMYYEAIGFKEGSEIARIKQKGLEDILMYPIEGVDPSSMITTANCEVFCAVGVTMPTLGEMAPTKINICRTVEITYQLAVIENAAEIAALVEVYENTRGFKKSIEMDAMTVERYDLKFESETVPGIYYCLTYWRFPEDVLIYELIDDFESFEILYPNAEVTTDTYEDEKYAVYNFGKNIIYNRTTGLCYPAGEVIENYLRGPVQED